ncbi:MAG: hypothetical protein EAX96_16480 [Candidatus Lokiarchaeota archaeon]|nr:hypothetical protein [Candidatus Lokiarchaeota archaeon]
MDSKDQELISEHKATISRLKKSKTEEEKIKLFTAYLELLEIFKNRQLYLEGKENGIAAMKIAKKLKDKFTKYKNLAKINEKLGDISFNTQDFGDSKKYFLESLKNFQLARIEVSKIKSPEAKKEDYFLQFDYFTTFLKNFEVLKKDEGEKNAFKYLEKKWNELFKKEKNLSATQGLAHLSTKIALYYFSIDEDDIFWENLAYAYLLNKLILRLYDNNTNYWLGLIADIEDIFNREILKLLNIKEEKNEVGLEILEALSQLELSKKDHFHLKNIIDAKENFVLQKSPKEYINICDKAVIDVSSDLLIFINSEKVLALIEKGEFNLAVDLGLETLKELKKIKNDRFKTFFNGKINLNLARVYYRKNDRNADKFARTALTFFQKDITADNHASITLLELAYFYIQQNKFAAANKLFEEIIVLKGGGNMEILARTYEGLSHSEFKLLNFQGSFINASKAALIYKMIPGKEKRYNLNLSNSMNIFIEYLQSLDFSIQS